MKKLDRTKAYATIHGFDHGRCFEQDGIAFDADGCEWNGNEDVVAVYEAQGNTQIDDQIDAQFAEEQASNDKKARDKAAREAFTKANKDGKDAAKAAMRAALKKGKK